jgi:hypothetical protein
MGSARDLVVSLIAAALILGTVVWGVLRLY